jgi:plasmid maintenance system antidote protein VapI
LNLQSNYDLWHSMKHKEIRKVKKLVKVWIY